MRQGCAVLLALLLLLIVIGQCGKRADNLVAPEPAKVSGAPPVARSESQEGIPFNVASDPNASYRLLKWSRMQNGNIEAVTVRAGPSGTSYARREIDCGQRTFRYLGEGDTAKDAMRDSPAIGEMADLVSGSIADVTVDVVCTEARK